MIDMTAANVNPGSQPDQPIRERSPSYYQIEMEHTKARYLISGISYVLVLSYALWNAGMLGRPEQQVLYECAALMMALMFGLPLLYKPVLSLVGLLKQLSGEHLETAIKRAPRGL